MSRMIKNLMVVLMAALMFFTSALTPVRAEDLLPEEPSKTPTEEATTETEASETTETPELAEGDPEPEPSSPEVTEEGFGENAEAPALPEDISGQDAPVDSDADNQNATADPVQPVMDNALEEDTAPAKESNETETAQEVIDEITSPGDVYFYNARKARAANDPTINAVKTVEDKDENDKTDGIYELSLSINATSQQSQDTKVQKLNVVMMIDVSGSMDDPSNPKVYSYDWRTYDEDGNYWGIDNNNVYWRVYHDGSRWRWVDSENRYNGTVYTGTSRLEETKTAANKVVDELLKLNVNDAEIGDIMEITVAKFSSKGNTQYVIRDSTNASAIKTAINNLKPTGGTNWQVALQVAKTEADYFMNQDPSRMTDPVEKTSVIFLTDGFPTYYGNDQGYSNNQAGQETAQNVNKCYSESRGAARAIVTAGYDLYNIFAYGSDSTKLNNHTGYEYLCALTNYAYTGTDNYSTTTEEAKKYCFNAKSTDELVAAFKTIIDQITNKVGFAGVDLTDGVSLGATSTSVTLAGKANADSMRYTVKDESDELSYTVKFDNGTAYFTIYDFNADGTTVERSTNEPKTITTEINGKTYTSTVYSVTVGEGDAAKTYMMTPASINGDTGMVDWDLAGLGILQSGYTYTVAFDVWANQTAYDICADLNNGIYTDIDSALDDYGVKPTDRQHIKDSLIKNDDGSYSLKTNYSQDIRYYPATSTTDSQGKTTWTYGDETNHPLDQPDPIPLKGSKLELQKVWKTSLSEKEYNEMLYENGVISKETSKKVQINLNIWKADTEAELLEKINKPVSDTNKPYFSKVLGWDDETGTYPAIDEWKDTAAVAPGMMVNIDEAAALGFDTTDTSKIKEFTDTEGTTRQYYIIENGHYYYVTEDGSDLHYELEPLVYHPMVVDGELYNVAFGEGKTVEKMELMTSVKATNYLKGGLNITKVVSTTDINVADGKITGVTEPVKDGIKTTEDEFAFEIQIWKENANNTKTAVLTPEDQIDAERNKAKSGSIGYRVYSKPKLVDGNVSYDGEIRGAILEETSKYKDLAGGNYATVANGVTTLVLTMPANGEIRLVNLPSGTKYVVREIVSNSDVGYRYAATKSQIKSSDTEVSDVAVATGNTVNGTIQGNKANIETYYNCAASFYVYHSSDNTVEKISMSDKRVAGTYVKETADKPAHYEYTFNIVNETKKGYLYGGYYKGYGQTDSTDDMIRGLEYTASDSAAYEYTTKSEVSNNWAKDEEGKVYNGPSENGNTTTIWNMDNTSTGAYTESGKTMSPKANYVYYLKEVPDAYLEPATYVVYDKNDVSNDCMQVKKLYLMSLTDDGNYKSVGFDVILSANLTKKGIEGGQKTAEWWSTKIDVVQMGNNYDTLFATSIQMKNHGLIFANDVRDYIYKNAYYKEIPYWITPDEVKVTGKKQMIVMVRNTRFKNWKSPGMTKSGVAKTPAYLAIKTGEYEEKSVNE